MLSKIIINLFIIFILPIIVILIKTIKSHKFVNNAHESVKGIAYVVREDNSKKVSECFECAEKSLESAKVNNFSIENFFEKLN